MPLKTIQYQISVAARSHIGRVRSNNEDVWRVIPEVRTYMLADGMGGHQAGEVAAREAIDVLETFLSKHLPEADQDVLDDASDMLDDAIQKANQRVYFMGKNHPDLKGMGTTLCCLHLHPEGVVYGHVGDSRIYRLRDGQLEQLTRDHSLVREMIDKGQLSEQDASDAAYRNIITRAIGADQDVIPSVRSDTVHADDLFLMCSDGLSDLLPQAEVEEILKQPLSLKECADALITRANEKGGSDNITVVLIKLERTPHPSIP